MHHTQGFMKIHQLACPSSLIKFPLVALLGLLAAESIMAPHAMAGSTPVALPDSGSSGVSDSFAPSATPSPSGSSVSRSDADGTMLPTRIGSGALTTLRTIGARQFVRSVGGQTLSISPQQVSSISSVLSANDADIGPAISVLEQQLSAELGGLALDISLLGSSTDNLSTAITAANQFILSLDSTQLAAAIESPTFMAMLEVLGGANQALIDDDDDIFVEGGAAVGIPRLSLL